MFAMKQMVHLKTMVNSIIMFDKESKVKTNIGFNCSHESSYSLNEQSKRWFEEKITMLSSKTPYVPDVLTEPPWGMDNTLITTMNFQNFVIFLVMNDTDVKQKERIHQFSVIELMSLMHKSLHRKLNLDDLKDFVSFKDAYDCVGCRTKKLCFPKHSYDVNIL